MATWFTSDTHFGHARIIELCDRPFKDVDHMDEMMIERWNAVVAPEDRVLHLGDVALGKIDVSLPKIGRLNGHKILVPGNHDRIFSGESESRRERFRPAYEEVFQEIWSEIGTWVTADFTALVSHFPYQGDSHDNDRHVDKRPKDAGLPLIHGHIHSVRREEGRMFNVGVDVNDFTPVHEDVLKEWVKTL